jgi:hypothetical protein
MKNYKILVILVMLMNIGFANAQDDKKVAVFDPAGDVPSNLKMMIREELSNSIVNTLGFTVLERELINKVLAESKFQMTGHVDDGQIGELGKKMGANYVCYATISPIGDNFYISCKMVDVLTAKIERQNTGITQSGLNDLFAVVSTVSRDMLQQPGTSTGKTTTKTTAIRTTPSKPLVSKANPSNTGELIELNVLGLSLLVMPIDINTQKITWTEANKACLESTAYGLNDWRLPDKTEISRMFVSRTMLTNIQRFWYWSSSIEKGDNYFRQAFDADKLEPAAGKAKAFARCVHNNGAINLVDENGVWGYSSYGVDYQVMPEDLVGVFKWEEAKNACESSTSYGYSDWYLPAINELEFMYSNKVALMMTGDWYWSSTPKSGNAIFDINFETGKRFDTSAGAKRKVRCVRKK